MSSSSIFLRRTGASCGVDISGSSVKWLTLVRDRNGERRVGTWGEVPLIGGIVEHGRVRNLDALSAALREIVPHMGEPEHATVALPAEVACIFSFAAPEAPKSQVLRLAEFELESRMSDTEDAIYDVQPVAAGVYGVVAYPGAVRSYMSACKAARITPWRVESQAQAIARAVCPEVEAAFIVDMGRSATGLALVRSGVPVAAETVAIGGEAVLRAVQRAGLALEDAVRFCAEEGLDARASRVESAAMQQVVSLLAERIDRFSRVAPGRTKARSDAAIVLVGGGANMKGLPEYLGRHLRAPLMLGNIWVAVTDFSRYVPPIDKKTSLQFATALGLALAG
jgi:Tfp pilus assembly PilM family ATPase